MLGPNINLKLFNQVIPRLLFDRWAGQDYVRLFKEKDRVWELGTVISKTIKVFLKDELNKESKRASFLYFTLFRNTDLMVSFWKLGVNWAVNTLMK